MSERLTQVQATVLMLIRDYVKREMAPPTMKEIADGMGYRSPNAAQEAVDLLGRKGYLNRRPGVARGIRVSEDGWLFNPRRALR
jgi:SOS-response transcriptional repressor LexA